MKFTEDEIRLAKRLKELGLSWVPNVGHFVWDEVGIIERESPFQEKVFFILDLRHFLRRAESMGKLQRSMVWLPDWSEARQILRKRGLSSEAVARRLRLPESLENNTERLCLYQMIEESLLSGADSL